MTIEILAHNMGDALEQLDIRYGIAYSNFNDCEFEVYEIDRSDLKRLTEEFGSGSSEEWFAFTKGSNRGTACNFITVNGQSLIGWDSKDGNETYDKLSDYLITGLGAMDNMDVCALAVGLAKANGISLSKLFRLYQG